MHVPLLPSSIIWYRPAGGDPVRLGRQIWRRNGYAAQTAMVSQTIGAHGLWIGYAHTPPHVLLRHREGPPFTRYWRKYRFCSVSVTLEYSSHHWQWIIINRRHAAHATWSACWLLTCTAQFKELRTYLPYILISGQYQRTVCDQRRLMPNFAHRKQLAPMLTWRRL